MVVLLGGRASELIVFGHLSTGAADDLQRVTDIARSMVMRFGMSERLGGVAYERDPRSVLSGPGAPFPPHEREYAEKTAGAVDEEVRSMMNGCCSGRAKSSSSDAASSIAARNAFWRRKPWRSAS